MNANMLKELYKRICGECRQSDRGWYEGYQNITSAVDQWRVQNPNRQLSAQEDRELLRRLLYEDSNGVSDYGQSTLGSDTFEGLIQDAQFSASATAFMRNSTHDTFNALYESVRRYVIDVLHKTKMPKLRVYRFASACDLSLSTVVNEGVFESVFWGLINAGLLDRPQDDVCRGDWYQKNKWLTSQIKTVLPDSQADEIDVFRRNMFVWFLWERYFNDAFQNKPQIVKYGPPGTGKTYSARREMKFCYTAWQIANAAPSSEKFDDHYLQLQFHPSFGYEDFLEGLRPVEVETTQADGKVAKHTELRLRNGQFKEFCRRAGRWEIDLIQENIYPDNNPEKTYLYCKVVDLAANGTAKARLLAKGDYWKLVFDSPNQNQTLAQALPPYFVLIDEINRAELSRTFGELMFCLEYRGFSGAVSTQYAELNTEKDAMIMVGGKAKFFVPTNIRIAGTMNTIDRSVESFDFALRRRFGWQFVGPDAGVLKCNLADSVKWLKEQDRNQLVEGWKALNETICKDPLLGREYQIGHAYLMNLKYTPESLERKLSNLRRVIWSDAVAPLLEEYLRGTYDKDESVEDDPLKKFKEAFGLK